ncbi:hypothetical protein GYMLUDRAFT_877441 [Collybiopsis luxurians FD-317 M1]|nr:hypothetical protein GYMLUDRAFT_877441 [Collybiopsis luxurians FD-317 M1]
MKIVWASAYRNSECFLPSAGLSLLQTVHDIEGTLLRAHRLDSVWADPVAFLSSRSNRFAPQTTPSIKLKLRFPEVFCIEIYRGRYLVIGGLSGFVVYDLQTRHEIYEYDASDDDGCRLFWLFSSSGPNDDDQDFYVPFRRVRSRNWEVSKLSIIRITPSGGVSIIDITGIQSPSLLHIDIGLDFCIFRPEADGGLVLLHIPTLRIYSLSLSQAESNLADAIFMPGYVLLISTLRMNSSPHKFFELFTLPDPHAATPATLVPTHCGFLQKSFTESKFTSSDINADLAPPNMTGSIWLVGLFNTRGASLLRITLQPNGTLSFHIPDHDLNPRQRNRIPYDLLLTVASKPTGVGTLARGVSRVVVGRKSLMALYNVHRRAAQASKRGEKDDDGQAFEDLTIDINYVKPIPQFYSSDVYAFDGFRGLLCTVPGGGSEVEVLNFVEI